MLFIAIFILKIQCSIYGVGSKGMRPIGPFSKTCNEHCLVSLAHMSWCPMIVWPLVSILRLALLPCQQRYRLMQVSLVMQAIYAILL